MSFDLKLNDGDLEFGPDGDFVLLTGREKLAQDLGKILLTRIGQDPGDSRYGTELRDLLGRRLDQQLLEGIAGKSVRLAVNFLQSLQFVQSTEQEVSFDEIIGDIEALEVKQPSFQKIQITLSVLTVSGLRIIFTRNIGR